MKNNYLLLACFIFLLSSLNAQEINLTENKPNKLSFEFGYNQHWYDMKNINKNYIETIKNLAPNVFKKFEPIEQGQNFTISINYQPFKFFSFGIYGSYQFTDRTADINFVSMNSSGQLENVESNLNVNIKAYSLGISSTYIFSEHFNLKNRENWLNRLSFGTECNIGISNANTTIVSYNPLIEFGTKNIIYSFDDSNNLHGQLGLKVSYDITNSPIITSLGIRGGYQFLVTNTLVENDGTEWRIGVDETPINLNFSGFYIGTFLTIGK